jgi:transposase InsO family protein
MPWKEVSIVSQREEFVILAMQPGANKAELCRRFRISRPTADKWLARARAGEKLEDRSRRPKRSPKRSARSVEAPIVQLRQLQPAWGARTLHGVLRSQGHSVPSVSTVHAILKRNGLIDPAESAKHQAYVRFEHAQPNDLWQMDFKGHFAMRSGGRCHPLTVLDDHSRYNLCLRALDNERGQSVQECLTHTFRRYGLPWCMLMDNGAPWGNSHDQPYTPLTVWLMRLGVVVSHSRPYHPQTMGKDERFHRTLNAELIARHSFEDLAHTQSLFDPWREIYNCQRPHQALGMQAPATRYRMSTRTFPERLPQPEYSSDVQTRIVQQRGELSYRGHDYRVPKAFRGQRVALRPNHEHDGIIDVLFFRQCIAQLNLHDQSSSLNVNHVSEHL